MNTMEKTELLACPFCGGAARFQGKGHETYDYRVYCGECGCSTQAWSHTKEKAMEAWNRRTPSPDNKPLTEATSYRKHMPMKCKHLRSDGGCSVLSTADHFEHCVQGPCPHEVPMTNADRIRAMSDEELAVTLMCPNEMGMAEIPCDHSDGKNCCACLLEWLSQPVEED